MHSTAPGYFSEDDDQLIRSIHACIGNGETLHITGEAMNPWDVDHVGNVDDAHVLAMENLFGSKTASGEILFVQNEEKVPCRDLCIAICKNFHHLPPPYEITIPESLGSIIGSLSGWFSWLVRTQQCWVEEAFWTLALSRYGSGRKAERVLGPRPKIGLEEGLRRSCEHFAVRLREDGFEVMNEMAPDGFMISEIVSFCRQMTSKQSTQSLTGC